jgi:hypothetical protein
MCCGSGGGSGLETPCAALRTTSARDDVCCRFDPVGVAFWRRMSDCWPASGAPEAPIAVGPATETGGVRWDHVGEHFAAPREPPRSMAVGVLKALLL